MDSNNYILIAARFQLLSHPGRLHILDELRRAPACVCHLQAVLKRPQVYISQQLRLLREAGVVEARQQGLNTYYHFNQPESLTLLETVCGPAGPRTAPPNCPCPQCRAERSGETADVCCD